MIIDENIEKKLITWNDTEPIFKQFERKCAALNRLSSGKLNIDPYYYAEQYDLHLNSLTTYTDYQTDLYQTLYEKYPNFDFGMGGRLKSIFSHYEKVIRKFVDLYKKSEFKLVEVFDDYAIKVFIRSVSFPVDKISIDSEGIYIDSGADEFRITDTSTDEVKSEIDNDTSYIPFDSFDIPYEGSEYNVVVEPGQKNISIVDNIPYISTVYNGKELTLPLNSATYYKRSSRADLIDYCRDIQKDIEHFFYERGFKTEKRKDYITQPKLSGYSSRQISLHSTEEALYIECQIRTADMEKFSNEERKEVYKPHENELTRNAISRVPRYTLTTKLPDGAYYTYTMPEEECFEYTYKGISLKEYRKQMNSIAQKKEEDQR